MTKKEWVSDYLTKNLTSTDPKAKERARKFLEDAWDEGYKVGCLRYMGEADK